MGMKKYGTPEKFTTFTGEEVKVVDEAFQKTGKTAVSEFDKDELDELQKALDALEDEGGNPAPTPSEASDE